MSGDAFSDRLLLTCSKGSHGPHALHTGRSVAHAAASAPHGQWKKLFAATTSHTSLSFLSVPLAYMAHGSVSV